MDSNKFNFPSGHHGLDQLIELIRKKKLKNNDIFKL